MSCHVPKLWSESASFHVPDQKEPSARKSTTVSESPSNFQTPVIPSALFGQGFGFWQAEKRSSAKRIFFMLRRWRKFHKQKSPQPKKSARAFESKGSDTALSARQLRDRKAAFCGSDFKPLRGAVQRVLVFFEPPEYLDCKDRPRSRGNENFTAIRPERKGVQLVKPRDEASIKWFHVSKICRLSQNRSPCESRA